MPRKPIGDRAQTSAERQRTYRERLRAAGLKPTWVHDPDRAPSDPAVFPLIEEDEDDRPKEKPSRLVSRPRRWTGAVEAIREVFGGLEELREEYEYWRDNLPDNQRDGIVADKLDAAIAAIQTFEEAINELEAVDLPLGFGRD